MLYYHIVMIVHAVDFWPTLLAAKISLNIYSNVLLSISLPFLL